MKPKVQAEARYFWFFIINIFNISDEGVKLIFTGGHISLEVAFKGQM